MGISLPATLAYVGWTPEGLLGYSLGWLAIMSPVLALFGGFSILVGAIVAARTRAATRTWLILGVGTAIWVAAFYALSVPGLIDLP